MPKAKTKEPAGLVNIRLNLSPADHSRLRIAAAMAGQPMALFTREAVLDAIRRKEKNPKKSDLPS